MTHPFDSVLIANRGEIAVRVIRACRKAGLRSIAVYSDADVEALHVKLADGAQRVGPSPAAESYLNASAIIEAARLSRAQAIHPGYGFLSEDCSFAERCQEAGLIWIGPPSAAMRLLGDKAAAKALAEQLGVPTLPGYGGDSGNACLRAQAERIGYPLLVKAAAGGGGRGMRFVAGPEMLDEALESAQREAQATFGDGRLLLERFLERPRHVEMQIFGDHQGTMLYLGERDCSIQRRYQKVIEEAPAPHFSEQQRRGMGEASVKLAKAGGYANAGTVEFLLDQDGSFYFLEVNARLQVEHPVTEMVTGLDLVDLQFRVAAGQPLPLSQEELKMQGHAIEARLYAEDPATGFLPSSGRLDRLELPLEGNGVRVDTGITVGTVVPSFYDSLLAKIIVHAHERSLAVEGMAEALGAVVISGLKTNVDFLRAAVAAEAFQGGRLHTGFVQEQGLHHGVPPPADDLLIAAAASEVLFTRKQQQSLGGPWLQAGPWRVGWIGSEVRYRHGGELINVGLRPPLSPDESWRFELPGGSHERTLEPLGPDDNVLVLHGGSGPQHIQVVHNGNERLVRSGARSARFELASGLTAGRQEGAALEGPSRDVIRAPMPGRIARVAVKPGDHVKTNQTVVVLEAMKIEHLVGAPRDGVVERVRYKENDQVTVGAELVDLKDPQ